MLEKLRNRERGRFSSKSVFMKLLLSYLVILLLPVGIGSLFYNRVERSMVDNSNRAHLGLLEQVRLVMDNKTQEMERLALQIALYPKLPFLLNIRESDSDVDQYQFIEFMNYLNHLEIGKGLAKDIHIYFARSNTILSPRMKTDLGTFLTQIQTSSDPQYQSAMKQQLSNYAFQTYLPSMPVTVGASKVTVVPFLQSLPLGERAAIEGSLLIQMDEEQLKSLVRQIEWVNQGEVYILNKEGHVIMSPSDNRSLLSEMEVLNQNATGSTSRTINGQEWMLSYTTSAQNGWKYVSVVPKSIVMAKVEELKSWAVSLLIISLAGGILLCYLLTYRNYGPIRDIVGAIVKGQSMEPHPKRRINEFDFIQQAIARSLQEEKRLRETVSRQVPVIQDSFFSRLLRGYGYASQVTPDQLQAMGIHFDSAYFGVLIIELVESGKDGRGKSEEEQELAQFIIQNLSVELLQARGYAVVLDRHRIAVICCVQSSSVGSEEMKAYAFQLKTLLEDRFHIQATLALSSIRGGLQSIGRCYGEALLALEYKITKGTNTIISHETIPVPDQHAYYYPMELEVQLMNLAESGDYTGIEQLLNQIYEVNVKHRAMTPDISKCLFFDMLGTLLKLRSTIQPNHTEDNVEVEEDADPFKLMLSCTTADDMLVHMKIWYESICKHVKLSRSDHSEKLLTSMSQFIDREAFNSNFNLTAMADYFNLSSQYLSTFYKKGTGHNISDRVALVRINQAKKLMADRSLTITEIAHRVGYTSDIALIRVFKKINAVTPGKYREFTKPLIRLHP